MITLIGEDLAKVGLSFVFDGPADVCEQCRFKASCVDNLEIGRKYTITNVKDIAQKCEVHDGGTVLAVEVEKSDIECFIDTKKVFIGSSINFTPPECDEECNLHKHCFPDGLIEKDKCIILKDLGKNDKECVKGFSLTKVLLKISE